MRKRIFISIDLPKEIKIKIADFLKEIKKEFPENVVKWVKIENLHLTLAFLGYVLEKRLPILKELVLETANNFSPFLIEFSESSYGPEKTFPPRLIWIKIKKTEKLEKLSSQLTERLIKEGFFQKLPDKEFVPHITLGRIRKWLWRQIEPEQRPQIFKDFPYSFLVKEIFLKESKLKKQGPQYFTLFRAKLK